MTILFPALAAAFAALCVWLTVRIVNRKERWAKWTLATVVVGLPLLYVVSFGPVGWIAARTGVRESKFLVWFYGPLVDLALDGPEFVAKPLWWWMDLGKPKPKARR